MNAAAFRFKPVRLSNHLWRIELPDNLALSVLPGSCTFGNDWYGMSVYDGRKVNVEAIGRRGQALVEGLLALPGIKVVRLARGFIEVCLARPHQAAQPPKAVHSALEVLQAAFG